MGDAADDLYEQEMYYLDGMADIDLDLVGLFVSGHQKTDDRGPIETEKAILWVRINGEEVWLPRSQVIAQHDDTIQITDWLADKRGWTDHNVNLAEGETYEPRLTSGGYDLNDDIPF